ncbi:MAG: ankyrin repeat domain-containing protein [Smithella sp.]
MKHHDLIFASVIAILFIVSGCASTTPLIKALKEGDSLTVQKLIDSGVDINARDSRGYNALFYAVEYGQLEVVKSLISKGANLESKDSLGSTPLVYAAYYGFNSPNADNIIKLLIKSGADINAKSPYGETVLDLILSSARGDIVDELIRDRNINIWIPEAGKARVFFTCIDLYDYLSVTVGNQTKPLNQHSKTGVAFIDVDTGKHIIDANHSSKYISKNRTSIDVTAGQVYYFEVTQNMRNRIIGYAIPFPSTFVDKVTSTPFPITPLKESEAKQKIKEILKSKEI